jgi:hypothetical protein
MLHVLLVFLRHVNPWVYIYWGWYVLCLAYGLIAELRNSEYYVARITRFSEGDIQKVVNQIVDRKLRR